MKKIFISIISIIILIFIGIEILTEKLLSFLLVYGQIIFFHLYFPFLYYQKY